MKKIFNSTAILLLMTMVVFSGCSQQQATEEVKINEGEPLVYLAAVGAVASSFDKTPDWAPEPNPMAPADGNMLTRWSSGYEEGEQWIYFELGKESVVSDVIVRWERAHATEYKILVSKDAKKWKEVYHEKSSKGGSQEAVFSSARCKYVKILGLKRVNLSWGISIWEVEIYGPKSENSQAVITKSQYLSKGEDETKKEEAAELIKKLAAEVVPLSKNDFQKGIVYTSWMADELSDPASDFTLAGLKEMGMDTIAIMIPAYQETLRSEKVFVNDGPSGDTPTMESLKHAIQTCHKLGMRVMLKPHVDPRTDEARINIMPSEKWFDSYEAFIVKYAKFSQENNVEMYSIGTELEATSFEAWTHRWDQLIVKVKAVYTGALTYSANWTEYKEVPFWDKMDYVGLDAYFPLTNDNEASLQDLIDSWEGIADEIEEWRQEKGLTDKGVVLTEIGYPSADGANRQPWVAISETEDQQEQADCLEAVFTVLHKRSWFKGYYVWQYFPQERWSPLGFTVDGKRAEEVIRKWTNSLT
ncbi:MAG: discoidin domain-containing protein [Candidatus Omnitrophica bacterium]|nr:discoidin domain-containing protein [Candidatus Omnitrophota bacterium]